MVQTRRTKLMQEPLASSNEHPAAVNSPARSSDSTQSDSSSSMDGEGEASQHSNDQIPEDEESKDAGLVSQHGGSALPDNPPLQTRGLRLRTPSESGLSSDPMYEDEDKDEGESKADFFSEDDDETFSEDSHREDRRQVKAGKAPPKRHPTAPRISKLQKKIQDAKAMGVDLDENGVRKGRVRHTTNGLEYFSEGEWIPACYHTDIRKKLLQLTDGMGSYVKEPSRGYDELDRTAFEESQKDWVFSDRRRRPDVLFLWEDPGYYPDYDPEFWYDLGRIVLDTKNHPLKLVSQAPSLH